MPDYQAINRGLDRGDRWLFLFNLALSALAIAMLVAGGLGATDSRNDTARAEVETALGDIPQSISEAEVRSRILGRAPFRTGRVAKAKELDELGAYRLIGASVRGEIRKAYVRDLKLDKVIIKEAGEQLGSYEIVEIEKQHLKLRKGSEDFVLRK